MKKILLFASAVAVLFSSCSTDSTQDVIGNEAKMGTITAEAAYQQDGTRTYLNEAGDVVWSKGDALGVFGVSGVQTQFGLVKGEDTVSGTFAGNTNYLKADEAVYAYYPYDRNAEISGSKVKLEIAATQTYLPSTNPTFDAAQAPAFAYIKKLADKEDIVFNFKGAASYLSFPVVGNGSLESLTLTIADQKLAGKQEINIATEDDSTTPNVDETPAIIEDNMTGASITVKCGAIELHPENPVYVTFVVPVGVDLSKKITLTAKVSGTDVVKYREIGATAPATTRNNGYKINADAAGNAWTFSPKGYYIIDDVAKYGLTADEAATLDFITYAYFTQADQPSAYVGGTLPEGYNGPSQADWNQLYAMDAEAHYLKALICAEVIDFENFDAEGVFAKLGVYTTESTLYDLITVYKNALTWYIKNDYAIESMAWGESPLKVMGYDSKNPAVINGLTVIGNGISAPHTHASITTGLGTVITYAPGVAKGMGLENLEFTNTIVIADNSRDAGFVAPTSKDASIKNVVIGAGNTINGLEADAAYSVGGIYGVYYGGATGVVVETLPEVIVREDATTYGLRPSGAVVMPSSKNGQVFGSVYAGTSNIVINLNDYKVVSLDAMPAVHTVSAANNHVIDFVAADAIGATIDNVFVANGATVANAASVVLNKVSYWNGFAAQTAGGADYYTAEELAYVLAAGNSANITLTHNIDMQCVDTEEESQVVTLTHYESSAFNVNTTYTGTGANKVYNVFEIKNLIGKTVDARVATLFGYTANVSNVTLSNVTIETGYNANYIAGLAYTGTAQNVVINDLTINVGKAHNEATTIGGVFGTAVYNSVKNVTVNSCAINYEGTAKSNVGIIAGTLTINPDATETLEGVKISSNKNDFSVSKNFGEWWTKGADLANFKASASYAGRYPYGVVAVANAQFATAGNVKAYLAAKDCQSWSSRIAAGVVFSNALTDAAAAKVEFDAAKEYKYAFYLNDGLTIGNNECTVFGFSKK